MDPTISTLKMERDALRIAATKTLAYLIEARKRGTLYSPEAAIASLQDALAIPRCIREPSLDPARYPLL